MRTRKETTTMSTKTKPEPITDPVAAARERLERPARERQAAAREAQEQAHQARAADIVGYGRSILKEIDPIWREVAAWRRTRPGSPLPLDRIFSGELVGSLDPSFGAADRVEDLAGPMRQAELRGCLTELEHPEAVPGARLEAIKTTFDRLDVPGARRALVTWREMRVPAEAMWRRVTDLAASYAGWFAEPPTNEAA
jgi:hypothetical protein